MFFNLESKSSFSTYIYGFATYGRNKNVFWNSEWRAAEIATDLSSLYLIMFPPLVSVLCSFVAIFCW